MNRLRFGGSLLVALVSLLGASALAQTGLAFEGTYRLTMGHAAARTRIEQAIEAATDDMGPLRRSVANRRLEARNPVVAELEIDLRDDTIWIRYADESFDLPRNRFGSVPVPGGETAQARARIRGDRLLVDWRMEDGTRHDVFRLNGNQLVLTLRVESDQLPEDVLYRLPFRRVD